MSLRVLSSFVAGLAVAVILYEFYVFPHYQSCQLVFSERNNSATMAIIYCNTRSKFLFN